MMYKPNPTTYKVVARLKKPFFRKARVVYDVVQCYSYYDDPSYGHGGGDWHDAERVIMTYEDKAEAESIAKALS